MLFRIGLVFFLVVILASYAVPLWFTLHDEKLLVVTSGSMEPAISAGDAVVVSPVVDASQLRVGQPVTFWPMRKSFLVTHRIVELVNVADVDSRGDPMRDQNGRIRTTPHIRTQGDAVGKPDPDLTPVTSVRGIVTEVHSGWGWFLSWAHSPMGRLMLFAPPLLMIAGAEVLSRVPMSVRTSTWNQIQLRRRRRPEDETDEVTRDSSTPEHDDALVDH